MPGTLYLVSTPIGNLEDITLRALRVLREVTLIAAEDTRRTAKLLNRHAISTPSTSLHEHNERQKLPSILVRLTGGASVALVSDAGTPTISDPGRHLVAAAIEHGIKVEPVPGASAIMTLLAASGLPTEPFTFLGFPPIRSNARIVWFDGIANTSGTAVFFEAPHRIRRTLTDLAARLGDVPIVVGRELTKAHEELVRGPISEALKRLAEPRGEITVAVAPRPSLEKVCEVIPDEQMLATEFGELTNIRGLTRRQAISELARKYGLPSRVVYQTLEQIKK